MLGLKEFERLRALNGATKGLETSGKKPVALRWSRRRVGRRSSEEDVTRTEFQKSPARESVAELLKSGVRRAAPAVHSQ